MSQDLRSFVTAYARAHPDEVIHVAEPVSTDYDVSSKLYFGARSTGSGTELWTSDGTQAGTRQIIDLFPGYGQRRHKNDHIAQRP